MRLPSFACLVIPGQAAVVFTGNRHGLHLGLMFLFKGTYVALMAGAAPVHSPNSSLGGGGRQTRPAGKHKYRLG